MSETNCSYVSSHGIMKSCDLLILSLDMPNIELYLGMMGTGQSIYVNANFLITFYKKFWKYIKVPIVIVSGNQDINFPDEFMKDKDGPKLLNAFLNEPNLLHWFSQNMKMKHAKITSIPIGLDYHTLAGHIGLGHPWGKGETPLQQEKQLIEIQKKNIPWSEQHAVAFCNWHFFAERGDREEALSKIEPTALFKIPQFQQRLLTWNMQRHFCFVASPQGGGLDCHRTWEAILLGCVPILKSWGDGDSLFDELPVWIVKDWSEVTTSACEAKKKEFEGRSAVLPQKVFLKFWVDKIRSYSSSASSTISASL